MLAVLEAIAYVEEDRPGLVRDVLLEVFQNSVCLDDRNAFTDEKQAQCGRCLLCQFIAAVERAEGMSSDPRDTAPSEGPPSSDPVDYADTVITGLTLSPASAPRIATLQVAFNLVADSEDWRNPIATTLDETVMANAGISIDDVRAAIEHYTSHRPSVVKLDDDTWFVKSKGYHEKSIDP